DILSGFDELKIAVAYELDGERLMYPPLTNEDVERVIPVYETLPGWMEDISDVRRMVDLPANARAYIDRIAALLETPIHTVSVGPERDQLAQA
ncbi:MAG: adenylosuccinate synthetase, partial [Armatimonadetes bacterium]|nr:adenylosuccinate synthetase [Anaerolineae bacterium]